MNRPVLIAAMCVAGLSALYAAGATDAFIEVAPGVNLYVHEEGRGTPLIAIHGGPGLDSNYLTGDFARLTQRHRVFFYDQRGSGRSTLTSNVTADQLVADLDVLRQRLGLGRVALVGHSWGGGLAALYTASHPERVTRLVLVDAMPPEVGGMAGFGQALLDRLTIDENARLRDATLARNMATTDEERVASCEAYWAILGRAYYADPGAASRSHARFCSASGASIANGLAVNRSVFQSLGAYDWRPLLARLVVPTLIVHGDKDPIPLDTARDWRKTLSNSRLLVLPNSGHMSYVEQPDAFFGALETFLNGKWPSEAR